MIDVSKTLAVPMTTANICPDGSWSSSSHPMFGHRLGQEPGKASLRREDDNGSHVHHVRDQT